MAKATFLVTINGKTPGNANQVLQKYFMEQNLPKSTSGSAATQGIRRECRCKRKLFGEVSVIPVRPAKQLKEDIHADIMAGNYSIGEEIVPIESNGRSPA